MNIGLDNDGIQAGRILIAPFLFVSLAHREGADHFRVYRQIFPRNHIFMNRNTCVPHPVGRGNTDFRAVTAHANNFNLIRLIAASQVFYNHSAGHLKLPRLDDLPLIGEICLYVIAGLPGVPIFFVISGFLVTQSYLTGNGGTASYFWRRSLRIFPALWTHYVVILAALAATGAWQLEQLLNPKMWSWIAGAFLIGSDWWGNIVSGHRPFDWGGFYQRFPSGVLWTINVEIGFYLLVPIVFAPIWRKLRLNMAVFLIFAAASYWFALRVTAMESAGVHGNIMGFMRNQPAAYFWTFLLGGVAALYWSRVRFAFEKRFFLWAAAYILVTLIDIQMFGIAYIKLTKLESLTVLRMMLLAGMVLSFAHSLPALGRPFRGFDLSYAIYLYHMLVVWTFYNLGFKESAWAWPPLIAIVITISAVSWFLIEKPAMHLRNWRSTPK